MSFANVAWSSAASFSNVTVPGRWTPYVQPLWEGYSSVALRLPYQSLPRRKAPIDELFVEGYRKCPTTTSFVIRLKVMEPLGRITAAPAREGAAPPAQVEDENQSPDAFTGYAVSERADIAKRMHNVNRPMHNECRGT